MTRFFVAPSDISENTVRLGAEDAAHVRVLRLRPDERFIVCDGSGIDYICRLGEPSGEAPAGGATATIIEMKPALGEPSIKCIVFAAYMKGDKLETVVQKSVELGAHEIVLFPSERCVSTPDGKSVSKKTARLGRIALEAAKQSRRGRVPVVSAAGSFKEAVLGASKAETPLFLYECEEKLGLKQAIEMRGGAKTFAVFTGPEGGFTPAEAEFAVSSGMLSVTMGPRILRCETAPVCSLAAVMFHTGNM